MTTAWWQLYNVQLLFTVHLTCTSVWSRCNHIHCECHSKRDFSSNPARLLLRIYTHEIAAHSTMTHDCIVHYSFKHTLASFPPREPGNETSPYILLVVNRRGRERKTASRNEREKLTRERPNKNVIMSSNKMALHSLQDASEMTGLHQQDRYTLSNE